MSESRTGTGKEPIITQLGATMRQHPLSAVLVGMGLVWLASSKVVRREASGSDDETSSSAGDRSDTAGQPRTPRSRKKSGQPQLLEGARSNLAELFDKQPLLLGAVGAVVGAGLAAAVPATQIENELLGDVSDSFRQQAREFSTQQLGQAGHIVDTFVETAKEEAQAQIQGMIAGR